MILIENHEVMNLEGALRGMRNPMNSWDKSDSSHCDDYICCQGCPELLNEDCSKSFIIGSADHDLAMKLGLAGSDHGKFLRQIFVCMDVTAPLYWWKEFDTYKVGTVANSTSTMHKLGSRHLTVDDFSWDDTSTWREYYLEHINNLIDVWRESRLEEDFREMIQDLLDSFNQRRTITLNYEVLRNMYFARKNHKQREWREFCKWIESLPYSELITTPRKGE